jgi:hypothetical protein
VGPAAHRRAGPPFFINPTLVGYQLPRQMYGIVLPRTGGENLETMKTKICSVCKMRKPLVAFGTKARAPDGLNWNCKECVSEYQRRRYAENPDQIRKQKREHMRRIRTDPQKRESQNASRRGNQKYLAKGREYNRDLKDKHFFKWRARLLNRTGNNVRRCPAVS